MFDAKISGEKNNGTVTLNGDLTIRNIEQIKETLRSALSRFNKFTVKIADLALKNENNRYIARGFSLQLNGTGRQNPK